VKSEAGGGDDDPDVDDDGVFSTVHNCVYFASQSLKSLVISILGYFTEGNLTD
jgi:hypothetical protein